MGKFGTSYSVMMLSFEGDHIVESKLEKNSISTNTLRAPEVYFAGNFDYFVAQDNGLLNLTTGEVCTNTAAVRSAYTNYLASVTPTVARNTTRSANVTSSSIVSATVTGLISTDLRSMYYHKRIGGYSNHCSPTAATNLVLYWSATRGKTELGTDADVIFSDLHTAMGTDPNTGTKTSKIFPAIQSYFTSKCPTNLVCTMVTCGNTTADKLSSYMSICDYIDDDIPVQLGVLDWLSSSNDTEPEGHSINVWGYSMTETTDYLVVSGKQDDEYDFCRFSMMNFNSFTYDQFEVVGYTL